MNNPVLMIALFFGVIIAFFVFCAGFVGSIIFAIEGAKTVNRWFNKFLSDHYYLNKRLEANLGKLPLMVGETVREKGQPKVVNETYREVKVSVPRTGEVLIKPDPQDYLVTVQWSDGSTEITQSSKLQRG